MKLPQPKREGGMAFNEVVSNRKSTRTFDNSVKVPHEILSQALWTCNGVRGGIFRTVPSAKNWHPLLIYVFVEDGVYKYDPIEHVLIKLIDGDHRSKTGTQTKIVTSARINFVFIGDLKKKTIIPTDEKKKKACLLDVGHITMALSLFAAANKMNGVVRGEIDAESLLKFLGLNSEEYFFTLAFSLGY